MAADTILHRLHEQGRRRPNAPAYAEKVNGTWVSTTWAENLAQVRQAGRALIALGVEPGDVVTILGFNRPEWVIFDLAGMLVGGAAAGIYTTNSPLEVKYIVEHAESSVILLEDEGQWEKVRKVREDVPCLKHVVMMKNAPKIDDPMVLDWESFMAKGNEVPEKVVDERLNSLKMDQLAGMIYTSGTTGPPKGVMLSHRNLAITSKDGVKLFGLGPDDSALSYLPLSHVAEQAFTIQMAITSGYQVYYAESGLKVADNLKEVQPTIVFGVPRVWERFYTGITAKLNEATGAKAKIAQWAQGVGRRVSALRNKGQEPSGLLAVQYKVADKLLYSKLKPAIGLGNAKVCVSGAAPIAPEILEFFSGLDIIIYEVYGQSEGSGPSTINRKGATKFGTVGQAWPNCDVKLGGDCEILVRGPNIFMGYYKNPAATADTLIDAWLYSGDLGEIDKEGYVTIVGRKKEIIITSGGKNVAPKNIEAALKNLPLVSQAVVIGDNRRYLAALITLEPEAASKFAQGHGITGDLHAHPKTIAAIQKEIDEKVNTLFARVEHVRGFKILPGDFSVENGELTPTLKIKRRVINDHFAEEIEAMYAS
ncbi:MAG: AMP-dependent synthetase/ligase [Ardenticatenaceae bacterium]